ncbi:MAG TPA: NUDIX domain-containing protein [Thermoplasmata archaeon]|nr:NUDIX domain-containing protein [Thermoplasmata archaeon]
MVEERIDQECVEGYLYVSAPLALLILRRPPSRDRVWVPVSGKVEAVDRSYPAALRREIYEETGFSDLSAVRPLDWEVTFDGPDGGRWRLHAYAVEIEGRFAPRLSDEHEAFAWVDPREARTRLHYTDNRRAVERLLERVSPPRAR